MVDFSRAMGLPGSRIMALEQLVKSATKSCGNCEHGYEAVVATKFGRDQPTGRLSVGYSGETMITGVIYLQQLAYPHVVGYTVIPLTYAHEPRGSGFFRHVCLRFHRIIDLSMDPTTLPPHTLLAFDCLWYVHDGLRMSFPDSLPCHLFSPLYFFASLGIAARMTFELPTILHALWNGNQVSIPLTPQEFRNYENINYKIKSTFKIETNTQIIRNQQIICWD